MVVENPSFLKVNSTWLAAALATNGVGLHPDVANGTKRVDGNKSFWFLDKGHDDVSAFRMIDAFDNGGASGEVDKVLERLMEHPDPDVRSMASELVELRPLDHCEFQRAAFINAARLARMEGKKMISLGRVGRWREVVIEEEPSEATKRSLRI